MARPRDIVTVELLEVKEKRRFFTSLMYTLAENEMAGLPGAVVGSTLAPSKMVYKWRVLYVVGTKETLYFKGSASVNNQLMELPYLPGYEEYLEEQMKNPVESIYRAEQHRELQLQEDLTMAAETPQPQSVAAMQPFEAKKKL